MTHSHALKQFKFWKISRTLVFALRLCYWLAATRVRGGAATRVRSGLQPICSYTSSLVLGAVWLLETQYLHWIFMKPFKCILNGYDCYFERAKKYIWILASLFFQKRWNSKCIFTYRFLETRFLLCGPGGGGVAPAEAHGAFPSLLLSAARPRVSIKTETRYVNIVFVTHNQPQKDSLTLLQWEHSPPALGHTSDKLSRTGSISPCICNLGKLFTAQSLRLLTAVTRTVWNDSAWWSARAAVRQAWAIMKGGQLVLP